MKAEEFAQALEKGDVRPLYYLYGDEPYLIERGEKRLLSLLVAADMRDFNLNVFYGNESGGEEIVAAAQTLPMFATWRVVQVKNADKLSAGALDILTSYVQDPSPTTCLFFHGEKIDQRKRFFAEMKKRGALVEFKRLYDNQLLPFIKSEAASRGKRFQSVAAELLLYVSGNDLRELVSQVEKIALYVGEREVIEPADVQAIASDTKVDSVFALANSLGEKSVERALRNLHTLLADGEAPLLILAILARHFRQIWKVRELLERKIPGAEIGKSTGINPYFLQGIIRQAKNYRVRELREVFSKLFDLDLALKSSGGKPALLLECLVMDLCGKPGNSR